MAGLKQLLMDLSKVEGVSSAVVVGRDGFVIEGVSSGPGMDVDAVGAVVSTGVGSAEMMGRELSVGTMSQALLEFNNGNIVMGLLGKEAVLAVVTSVNANLGNIRYQVKKRAAEIQAAI